MTEHGRRSYAPRHPQLRQGVLNHEERWLGQPGLIQLSGGPFGLVLSRVEHSAQVQTQLRGEQFRATVYMLTEDRLALIEFARHIDALRPLPREHKGDRGVAEFRDARLNVFGPQRLKRVD